MTEKTSYSKAQAFKTCKQKFYYAHVLMHEPNSVKPGLMPLKKAHALARGSHGHAMMERYGLYLKDKPFPYSPTDVAAATNAAILWGIMENSELTMEIQPQITHLMMNVFAQKGWRIVEVERKYMLPVGTSSTGEKRVFPYTIDLLVEIAGQLVLIDYKFAADAYKEERLSIEPQLPLYIGAMRALSIPVAYSMYVFIRTRKMNNVEDQIVIATVKPNMHRIKTAFNEHLETMSEIRTYVAKPESEKMWPRNSNNNCDYCDFSTLCSIENSGEDTTLMRQTRFVANDYGYIEGED